MERRSIPIEAFTKPCLVEWIETLLDNNPQHPLLNRIRRRGKLSEKDRDSLVCLVANYEYNELIKSFRTKDIQDYICFILDVVKEDVCSIVFTENTYAVDDDDDFEGFLIEIRDFVLEKFTSQGLIRPSPIMKVFERMRNTIKNEVISALQSDDQLRKELGGCRTDFEELVKHLAYFFSIVTASGDKPAVDFASITRKNLSQIIREFFHKSPTYPASGDRVIEALGNLQSCLSEKLTSDQVDDLSSLNDSFKNELPKNPYKIDALRIFGNIFHHEAVSYAHDKLVRKYVDLACTFLDNLGGLLPATVCIFGIEHRNDGNVTVRVHNPEKDETDSIFYTSQQIKIKYKSMVGKHTVQKSPIERKPESLNVEAFLFPVAYRDESGRQNCFPILAERKVVSLSKAGLAQLEKETRMSIQIDIQTRAPTLISLSQDVQE